MKFIPWLVECQEMETIHKYLSPFQKSVRTDNNVRRVTAAMPDRARTNSNLWLAFAHLDTGLIEIRTILLRNDTTPVQVNLAGRVGK
jgi:hypothetical protein